MIQLYQCFDYWVKQLAIYPKVELLLIYNSTDEAGWVKGRNKSSFLEGIVDVLETQLDVQQIRVEDYKKTSHVNDEDMMMPFTFSSRKSGYILQHPKVWNTMV
jgi:hypothetical protein